jgi:predicted Fe-Mo cluster-binding NifX family protein
MKIVIPVDNDKQTIFKRTGQAPFFAVYEDEKFINVVKNGHGEGEHGHHTHDEHGHKDDEDHVAGHRKDLLALQGNDVILVQMIGEHMREALESLNLKIKKIRQKDGVTADEVIQNFLKKH